MLVNTLNLSLPLEVHIFPELSPFSALPARSLSGPGPPPGVSGPGASPRLPLSTPTSPSVRVLSVSPDGEVL